MKIEVNTTVLRITVCVLLALCAHGRAAAYDYYFRAIDAQFDSIAHLLSEADFNNQRENIDPQLLDLLDQRAAQLDNRQLRARAIYWRVRMGQMSAQPAKCIEQLEQARALLTDGYDYDRACIAYQLAGNQERLGHYMQCYENTTEAIELLTQAGDHYFLGNAHLLLAQMFLELGDHESGRKQLAQARQHYEQAHYPLNRIYFFEAVFSDNQEKALDYYRESISTGQRDWGMTLQALINASSIFIDRQMNDSAEAYIDQAAQLLQHEAPQNPLFSSLLMAYRGKMRYQQGRLQEALADLEPIASAAELLHGERVLTDVYKYLWLICDTLGQPSRAYNYLKLYNQHYEAAQKEITDQQVPKAQAREAISRQADRIQLLEQEAQLNRFYLYGALLACVVVLLAALAVFLVFRQRYRIRQIENRELRNSLEQEAIIYKMNLKNYEDDIKQKDCELSSSTLLLANKNEVLQQLHDITKRYSDEGLIPKEYVRQMNDIVGQSLRNDDEWSRFKLHFTSVHPDFFVKLKERAADLTENDLRLCAYISIGMRAKQIAEMLNISPDSVNSNRYRLRKKLGLERDQKLDDFIRKI